jgi:hypothetical protein
MNDLAISAIETGAERITDDAVEEWRLSAGSGVAFA